MEGWTAVTKPTDEGNRWWVSGHVGSKGVPYDSTCGQESSAQWQDGRGAQISGCATRQLQP